MTSDRIEGGHRAIRVFIILAAEIEGPETVKSMISHGKRLLIYIGKQTDPKYNVLAGTFPWEVGKRSEVI